MIRAANLVWPSGLALAVLAASPGFAAAPRDCSARGATDRSVCRVNSSKTGSLDAGWLGRAIAAMSDLNASALRTGIDANARLAADTRLTRDSVGQGEAVGADAAFMRALESKPVSLGSRIKRLR